MATKKTTKKAPATTKKVVKKAPATAKKTAETTKSTTKPTNNNKKALAIASIVIPAVFLLAALVYTQPTKTIYYISEIVLLVVGIIGIILSRIGNSKETSKLATVGLIVSILATITAASDMICMPFISKMFTDCKRNEDGITATCKLKTAGQETDFPFSIPVYIIEEEAE